MQNKFSVSATVAAISLVTALSAQETDITQTPNAAGAGSKQSYTSQIGLGQGDEMTPDSSVFIMRRDPFRSVARGRNLFQRKFTGSQGLGPRTHDGIGNIEIDASLGAGLADSCAACHGRPRGSAGFGGDVFTRPDSRDAPHLFGLGLVEMLGDEITTDLRRIKDRAIRDAARVGSSVSARLRSKGLRYGRITAHPDGTVDTSRVSGVNEDLRVRPFFAEGKTMSIREFAIGAFNDEMGLEAVDPVLAAAAAGGQATSVAGFVFDGATDTIEAPVTTGTMDDPDADGVTNEVPASIVDHMEFYLLNYFKPGLHRQSVLTQYGRFMMSAIGCNECHVPNLTIQNDRRVADVETGFDSNHNGFNQLFATATPLFDEVDDGSGHPTLKNPKGERFVVRNIYADFKRHDLGPAFHERNFDGTMQREFMTEPLWGVGSTAPYGHDGRSVTLEDVILRHGGEALRSRQRFEQLNQFERLFIIQFLQSLVIFPPPDTASNLDPADPTVAGYPQFGHGSIKLSVLFNDPSFPE